MIYKTPTRAVDARPFRNFYTTLAAAAMLFGAVLSANSADAQTGSAVELPTDAASWINSPPLTSETLSGKAAILYFFEEG